MVTSTHRENIDSGVRDVFQFDPSTERQCTAEVTIEDATERYASTDNTFNTYADATVFFYDDKRHHDPTPGQVLTEG